MGFVGGKKILGILGNCISDKGQYAISTLIKVEKYAIKIIKKNTAAKKRISVNFF